MTKKEFLLLLDEIIAAEPGTLTGAEELENIKGWDSLAILGFMALVDEKFGFNLSPKLIADCKTVDDLTALVKDRITS